ncbi:DUF742 domain-containing protein [Streptomyces sp. NPDC047002]|uniref:DUF742 domain-containing protein n=1 Tax=Streptomyces sp. NPDC047002 TaxID=3155475 RepID=UPI003452A3E1
MSPSDGVDSEGSDQTETSSVEPAEADALTPPLVRPYVLTGGRPLPSDNEFDLTLLVMTTRGARGKLPLAREKSRLLDICSGGLLSVAEVVAHTQLPVAVVKLLLADLAESGHLLTRAPIAKAQRPDRQLLQDVLDGLERKFARG